TDARLLFNKRAPPLLIPTTGSSWTGIVAPQRLHPPCHEWCFGPPGNDDDILYRGNPFFSALLHTNRIASPLRLIKKPRHQPTSTLTGWEVEGPRVPGGFIHPTKNAVGDHGVR